jgi:D-arabinitol dehydrogenase (NADP+)
VKAVLYDAATVVRIADVPTPSPGPHQVLIQVLAVGVCGTDLHIHHGGFGARFPLIPGHEMVGVVTAIGAEVTRCQVGEQVTVNPNVPCGRCDYCLSGRAILCQQPAGYGSNVDGFFAEFVCVDEVLVFSVEGLPLDTAVFVEPAACAMHGLETVQVRPGSSVLVLGAGPTGQLLAQLLASGGASSVTVAGPVQSQLDTALNLGATRTVLIRRGDPAGNLAVLRQAADKDGYDIVVEATGAVEVGDICLPLTRNGGTVLIYGVTGTEDRLSISPYEVFRREITIKGSFAEMTSFGAAIDALRAGRVRTDGIITHRFPLADYERALHTLTTDPTAHKVVIDLTVPA